MTSETTGFFAPTTAHPRHRFSVRVEQIPNGPGVWNSALVTVVEDAHDDVPDRVVGTYERGLAAMYATFQPFRQLRDATWHDYALISADYTRVSVMDLTSGAIVAVEQPSDTELQAAVDLIEKNPDRYAGKDPADIVSAWGFCPTEFYVVDFFDDAAQSGSPDDAARRPGVENVTGQFALYAGCHWGDDSAWKIRHIDLSRLAEGLITCDDRFGYIALPVGLSLRDAISYWPESDRVEIAVSVPFTRATGAADVDVRDSICWADAPELGTDAAGAPLV